jgi:hypothetical protein
MRTECKTMAGETIYFYVADYLGRWYGIVSMELYDTLYNNTRKSWACGQDRCGEYEN